MATTAESSQATQAPVAPLGESTEQARSRVMDLIDEARRTPELDTRSLEQLTDELWGE